MNLNEPSMPNFIDKATYKEYLKCPKNTWLKLHNPNLQGSFSLSEFDAHLIRQGNHVEELARQLFPAGILIESFGKDAILRTQEYVTKKTPVIFQATFTFDGFLARNDILLYDIESQTWHLYEVKSKNSLEETQSQIDDIEDVSFQASILKECGIKLGKAFIIYLNKNYILANSLDIQNLFIIEDVTEKVKARETTTKLNIHRARIDLLQSSEKLIDCGCIYKIRSSQCETFKYSHSNVPDYSVHDISRIHKSKLTPLIDNNITSLNDIPEDYELSTKQKQQVNAYKQNKVSINHESIARELQSLKYPLYFFDYETYAAAIPIFKGSWSYQQMPVQFSLHVINTLNQEPIHLEYLHELASEPSMDIIQKLQEFIGPTGTVIVWDKSFEQKINAELAQRFPDHQEFLHDVNTRVYDLMDIFQKQMYIHPNFKGKTSIKNILPVLVPNLSYQNLTIKEGATASSQWFNMIYSDLPHIEKQQIAYDLRTYCSLDTYAMYAIWKHLMHINTLDPEPTYNHAKRYKHKEL